MRITEDWMAEVYDCLESNHGLTRSDAQGAADAQPFALAQSWGAGLSASKTAEKIMESSMVQVMNSLTKGQDMAKIDPSSIFPEIELPESELSKISDAIFLLEHPDAVVAYTEALETIFGKDSLVRDYANDFLIVRMNELLRVRLQDLPEGRYGDQQFDLGSMKND